MRLTRNALVVCVATLVLGNACGGSSNSGDNNGGSGGGEGGSGGSDSGGKGGDSAATGGKGGTAGGSAGASGSGGAAAGGSDGAATGGSGGAGGAVGGMAGGGGGYVNPLAGNPKATLLAGKTGFKQPEGPLWVATGGYLLFSEVDNGKIWKVEPTKPEAMRFTEFAYKTGVNTNGLAADADGNLLVCERNTGKVGKMKIAMPDTKSFLADKFNNMPFKAPNDVVVGKNGSVYFTDPTWCTAPCSGSTLPTGAYRVDKAGAVTLITTGANKPISPNGIALSPDEKSLYISDDMGNVVWKYAVATDGSTSAGAEFILGVNQPDGIAIDNAGNIYVTSNKIIVYKPDGTEIGQIALPDSKKPSNASFGGADLKTLFITGGDSIYSVNLGVPGIP